MIREFEARLQNPFASGARDMWRDPVAAAEWREGVGAGMTNRRVHTDAEVLEARKLYDRGVMIKGVAEKFGASAKSVGKICRRQTHLEVK